MGKFEFYFFCLYNSFYKDGFELQNYLKARGSKALLPQSKTVFLLTGCTYLWTFVFRLTIIVFFHPIPYRFLLNSIFELLILLAIRVFYNFLVLSTSRYNLIYAKYKMTEKSIQRDGIKKILIVLFLPIILIPILVLISTKVLNINLNDYILIL